MTYYNANKTKQMKINSKKDDKATANNNRIENVNDLTYIDSKITMETTMDVKCRMTKARANVTNLRNIWKSPNTCTQTKVRIFKTNFKT